jgi:thioredoxin family protein
MVLGLALSTFTATEAAKLTFKVTNPNEKVKVRLTFSQSGEQKEVAIDAAGNGNIEITGFTPQYVTMQYTRGRRTLYLDPNQDLTLSFDSDNMWRNTQPLKEQVPLSTPIWEAKSSNHSVCPI